MNSFARFKSKSSLLLPVLEGIGGTVLVVVSTSVAADRSELLVDADVVKVLGILFVVKALLVFIAANIMPMSATRRLVERDVMVVI